MAIIIGYLVFCFLVSLESKKYPRISAILIFISGAFINGYRSATYTGDNIAYVNYYKLNATKSLAESWNDVLLQSGKDPFYYFVGNVFSKMGFSYRGWFVFIAIVFMGGFCYAMYKYSKNYFLSVLFMVGLSYYYFSMTGLRQALAMGICFFAFDMACKKKLIPFLLTVFLASRFHSSALIFIPMYFVKNFKIGYKQWIAVIAAVVLAYSVPEFINNLVRELAWNEYIEEYADVTTGLTMAGFIIQLAIILFSIYFLVNDENYVINQYLLNAMFIGLIIRAFSINIDNIFRMSMYYSIYGAFMYTEAIEGQSESNKKVLYIGVSVVLMLYMLRAGNFRNLTMFGGV